MLNTKRLRIYPASREQMEAMIASEQDDELKKAYSESLEAETYAKNAASQRVLEKCGFRPNGTFGEEGPRFSLAPMEVKTNILTEETFTELYSSVGWSRPAKSRFTLPSKTVWLPLRRWRMEGLWEWYA